MYIAESIREARMELVVAENIREAPLGGSCRRRRLRGVLIVKELLMFNSTSDSRTKSFAKKLRKEMTRQERHLWYDFLRKHRCKWYKQKPIGKYVADFYCGSAKLVIELDGSQHYEEKQAAYDVQRSEYFKRFGITVIRFPNNYIDNYFTGVCEEIEKVINSLGDHR